METINYYAIKNTPVGTMFLTSIQDEMPAEFWKDINAENIKISMTINGYKVSFLQIIEKLTKCYDEVTQEKAANLLKDKASVLCEKLQKLERFAEEVEQQVKREIHTLFPLTITDEDYR